MTTSRLLSALTVSLTTAALCSAAPMVAIQPDLAIARDGTCAAVSPNPPLRVAIPPEDPSAPKISDLSFGQLVSSGTRARFRLAITGSNLGSVLGATQVYFTTKDPAHPVEDIRKLTLNPKQLVVEATAPFEAEINRVTVEVGGKSASSEGLVVSFVPAPPVSALHSFGVMFEHQKNKEFPNLHSILVTKKTGDDGVGFQVDPNLMQIELIPTGPTDLKVVQSNEQQLDLHFVAAPDYEPQDVVVTVFNSSDLGRRKAVAVATKATTPSPAEDPDQPKITRVDTVFLERSQGRGRIRISGQGFGEPACRPAVAVDEYVTRCKLPDSIAQSPCSESDEKKRKREARTAADEKFCEEVRPQWEAWQQTVRSAIGVGISPRNENIREEEAEIVDYNDKMVDVYFKFRRAPHYSWPFQLANVDLAIKKTVHKNQQTVNTAKVSGVVTATMAKTFTVIQELGPKLDPALSYRYTVLDKRSAKTLLGEGVGENFYVLQLSVVNNGSKKVAVPLAAIQAEVEWVMGHADCKKGQSQADYDYVEGPPTLSPIPMASVSAYFDAYEKSKGKKAIFFNILDGITTLAATLVPFVGPGLKDAQSVFTGGFIPGAHKVLGDLSGQQLQNLTALSWETIETLSANGGSKEKLIYIQRNEQFADTSVNLPDISKQTRKQISNIMDIQITSFQLNEGEAQQATPATTSAAKTAASPALDAASTAPAGSKPPAPKP